MPKKNGYKNTIPVIGSVRFYGGKIIVNLTDGRTLFLPASKFPDIEKLTAAQKRKHKILAGIGLIFDDIDTVYHISDFIGNISSEKYEINNIQHTAAAEPKAKYKKRF